MEIHSIFCPYAKGRVGSAGNPILSFAACGARKPTCEGPYMHTFALAGVQTNILWLVQWCRRLSGEPSARPCGAVTLLNNLSATQEICAVGVRGRLQISSQTCTDGCNNGPSNATGPVKTITVMALDAPRDGARNRHRTHLLRCCR